MTTPKRPDLSRGPDLTRPPATPFFALLRRDDAGGELLRRLLVPALLIPLLVGWLRAMGEHAGLFDSHVATFLRTFVEMGLLFALLWWTATRISWHASANRAAQARMEALLGSEREARDEAARAKQLEDDFLSTLSHELRTPLSAILGWAQLLSPSSEPVHLAKGLDAIQRNARMQTKMIEDLLDMSRIASGQVQLNVEPTDLAAVVEAALETVAPAAAAKGIRVRQTLDPHAGKVTGDPARLQQIVWNLLTNAIKFTPQDGTVDVTLERVKSRVEIAMHDSGIGITAEHLPHVFERFRQVDSSTTRRFGGLGLGLSVVKQLVELHGGTVRATSAGQGQGATFIVALPLSPVCNKGGGDQPAPPREATCELLPVDLAGVKVLVVDDEPDARAVVQRALIQCGAKVCTAGCVAEAMKHLGAFQPDVIVSDIGMPGTDGYQFIRSVRNLTAEEGGRTPAIALTAFARSEDRGRAMLAGFQVHLVKPIEPKELTAMVHALCHENGTPGDAAGS